ncbi:MAG: DEAD/DEAH box helicase, partial [Waterburya sp.]
LFDCKALAPSPRKLIEDGYLTFPRLFSYSLFDVTLLKTDSSGDYSLKSIASVCNEDFNIDVVEKWYRLCATKKTIVFASTVAKARHLTELFTGKGITCELITGDTSDTFREQTFSRFKTGLTQVLVSVGTLVEGYDETSIECVVIARPTRSMALLTQMVGRGLRLHDGKSEVFIIDCGECFNWLLSQKIEDPIDLSNVSLCPRFKEKGEIPQKKCERCGTLIPCFARICTHCGALIPPKIKDKPSNLKFPQLEEILTTETLKHYEWLRKEISVHFEKKTNPESIFNDFHRKYGYLPPKDYFLSSIFDLREAIAGESHYRQHLTKLGLTPAMINFFLDLEFGEPSRTYDIKGFSPYTRNIEIKRYD